MYFTVIVTKFLPKKVIVEHIPEKTHWPNRQLVVKGGLYRLVCSNQVGSASDESGNYQQSMSIGQIQS